MNSVVHFELPADDSQRAAAFYSQAFGWKADNMGSDMNNYVVVTTTPSDEKTGRPTTPGAINGGIFTKQANGAQYPSVVIGVDDIHAAVQAVQANGGKVLGEPNDIPGVGIYVSFTDTEGNQIAMLQPSNM